MSTKTRTTIRSKESGEEKTEHARLTTQMMPAWHPDGPVLRFQEMLKVTRVRKTKAYELMKSDPDFPKGIPLYDSGGRSPKFYWTREAVAWNEMRAMKFRNHQDI